MVKGQACYLLGELVELHVAVEPDDGQLYRVHLRESMQAGLGVGGRGRVLGW